MLRWHAKVICGVIMTVLMPICFLTPLRMVSLFKRWGTRGQNFLDLLSCFAGGVFLASYLAFMAPAVRVLIETNLMQPYGIEFPVPDTLIGIGFFMMLTINYIVRTINRCTSKSCSNVSERESVVVGRARYDSIRAEVYFGESSPIDNGAQSQTTVVLRHQKSLLATKEVDEDVFQSVSSTPGGPNAHGVPVTPQSAFNGGHTVLVPSTSGAVSRQPSLSIGGLTYADQHRSSRVGAGGSKRNSMVELAMSTAEGQSVVRSVVMMLALSVDSVLEGMTIGLKQTVVEVWAIFIGIVVHESVIAFCLGLQLVRLNAGRLCPVVSAAVVYTLMNPIGVIVATAVYETFDSDPRVELANGILQALTSGCFIYVIFYEILDGQITDNTPLSKIVAVFVGYVFLASFAAIPGSGPYHHVNDDVTEAARLNVTSVVTQDAWMFNASTGG